MRGLPAGFARTQPIDQPPYTKAAIAQTSANPSAYDMTIPSKRGESVVIRAAARFKAALRDPVGFRGSRRRELGTQENSLFCQCPVQKVEPILSPEELVPVDVRRRAEYLALDRLLGERLVARENLGRRGSTRQRGGVETKLLCDSDERRFGRDVALLRPDRTTDGSGQRHGRAGALLLRGENPRRREVAVHGKESWLAIERDVEVARPALELDQPVGLALGRALGQRQSAGHREHLAEIDWLDR